MSNFKNAEIIGKKEAKARIKEKNVKKNKKRDFKKWVKKNFKEGTYKEKFGGFGEGKILFCPKCKEKPIRPVYKTFWECNKCGSKCDEYTKADFEEMR